MNHSWLGLVNNVAEMLLLQELEDWIYSSLSLKEGNKKRTEEN